MTSSPTPDSPATPDRTLRDLDLGCRIGFLVLTVFFGFVVLRVAWPLSNGELFRKIFSDIFKGQPLPLGLKIAFTIQPALLGLGIVLPIAAFLAAFLVRRPVIAIFVISGCNLILALTAVFLWLTVVDCLGQIIGAMT